MESELLQSRRQGRRATSSSSAKSTFVCKSSPAARFTARFAVPWLLRAPPSGGGGWVGRCMLRTRAARSAFRADPKEHAYAHTKCCLFFDAAARSEHRIRFVLIVETHS
eukprot:Amastigsp_a10487_18.p3 type:complete len:109 gc:universal Amastigsp_a10487_18:527-201(-)